MVECTIVNHSNQLDVTFSALKQIQRLYIKVHHATTILVA